MTTQAGECRICGCTELNCSQCIERTGEACHWVQPNLCSACKPTADKLETVALLVARLARRLPADDLLRKDAVTYLRRNGLLGSPLRAKPRPTRRKGVATK